MKKRLIVAALTGLSLVAFAAPATADHRPQHGTGCEAIDGNESDKDCDDSPQSPGRPS